MSNNSIVERKCLNCGTWNNNEDFCISCNTAISPKEIIKIEEEEKRIEEINKPKDKFEIFAENLKEHEYFIARLTYKVGHSIGLVLAGIGAILAWVIAMVNA